MRRTFALVPALIVSAWVTPVTRTPPATRAAEDLLARSRAAYAALKSYTDSGTVTIEGATLDRHAFRTRFRRPADFYFEFGPGEMVSAGQKIPLPGRLVLWKLGPDLERWDERLQTHETFPAGQVSQIAPLAAAAYVTGGTISLIPSMLFPQAGIHGTLQEISEFSVAGTENVSGHPCHKLVGVAQSVYPSGQVTNVRPIAIWLDARTLLVRKVFEDTPKGYPRGSISRHTIVIEPQVNPALDDGKFRFAIPDAQE